MSGKFEIHCQALADKIEAVGFETIRPIPVYKPPIEGYEDTFADWERKIKGEYPLQLLNLHVPRRAHSNFDNVRWLQKAFPNVAMMNPLDAAEWGSKTGDTVLIRSRHGKILTGWPSMRPSGRASSVWARGPGSTGTMSWVWIGEAASTSCAVPFARVRATRAGTAPSWKWRSGRGHPCSRTMSGR